MIVAETAPNKTEQDDVLGHWDSVEGQLTIRYIRLKEIFSLLPYLVKDMAQQAYHALFSGMQGFSFLSPLQLMRPVLAKFSQYPEDFIVIKAFGQVALIANTTRAIDRAILHEQIDKSEGVNIVTAGLAGSHESKSQRSPHFVITEPTMSDTYALIEEAFNRPLVNKFVNETMALEGEKYMRYRLENSADTNGKLVLDHNFFREVIFAGVLGGMIPGLELEPSEVKARLQELDSIISNLSSVLFANFGADKQKASALLETSPETIQKAQAFKAWVDGQYQGVKARSNSPEALQKLEDGMYVKIVESMYYRQNPQDLISSIVLLFEASVGSTALSSAQSVALAWQEGLWDKAITKEDRKHLIYVTNALYPPVYLTPRELRGDLSLDGQTNIKGSPVILNIRGALDKAIPAAFKKTQGKNIAALYNFLKENDLDNFAWLLRRRYVQYFKEQYPNRPNRELLRNCSGQVAAVNMNNMILEVLDELLEISNVVARGEIRVATAGANIVVQGKLKSVK